MNADNKIAVIIVTKNRPDDIARYSLASLTRQVQSGFRDFICVVWDASDNDATQKVIESRTWECQIYYFHAPRVGMTSQRNDAINYVLIEHPDINFVLFIDDDCELSPNALNGILKTFETTGVELVNMTAHSKPGEQTKSLMSWLKRLIGMNRHGATEFLYNYGASDEALGIDADWTSGYGMAFKIDVFRDYSFPEAFQRFGGYALGEDFALSYFLRKKVGKRIINSIDGYCTHYRASGARLNIANMAAAKWYNFHLLFDALHNSEHGVRKVWLVFKFKLFMLAAAVKLLIRARSFNIFAVLRGIHEAKVALAEYHREFDIKTLFKSNQVTQATEREQEG